MLIFILSAILLIFGYLIYGLFVEKILGISEKNKTPAVTQADGIDFVPLHPAKIFLIQFLNIAGVGPVFGAILGALYGPVCLIWIVFGSIFAGAVHDMLSGVISLRTQGQTMTFFVKRFFGTGFYFIFSVLLIFLLILVGSIFAQIPANILSSQTGMAFGIWLGIIFAYYFLATLLPIDKIIGRFYPIFASCLIISTILLLIVLFTKGMAFYPDLNTLNQNPNNMPIFPLMFITIACGAISGFHATQSPLMARCVTNEKYARPIFYGAMILEGFIALIWATLGIAFYQGTDGLNEALGPTGATGTVVSEISSSLLGKTGGILTLLSIIALTITSGDTALRSARLSMADVFKINQKKLLNRLLLTCLVLGISTLLAFIDLNKIWIYFGWSNQMLATIMLWTGTFYLYEKKKNFWISLLPALFMTSVCMTYLAYAEIFLNWDIINSRYFGVFGTLTLSALLYFKIKKIKCN